MPTKRENKSGLLQTVSKTPAGSDPVLDWMKEKGLPLTRETYLATAMLEEPLDPELENELPEQFRKSV